MRIVHSIIGITLAAAAIAATTRAAEAPAVAPASAHWAYQKVVDPQIPPVKNGQWATSPLDHFILSKLEEQGLRPNARADKRTLIRRAYFDLVGLPPAPEDVEAFVADASPDAFARVVEKLLADPHYGERWGRYWLDVARYADTKGYVFEEERRYPHAYTYRDYVIRSLNEDKPYDRFLIEQIAADQLPLGEDKRPLAAMGFLTLGRRFLNSAPDIIDDRMDVVCRGTMGVTIGCARCHNHKFDPIPTADYYSLYSIFNNSIEPTDAPVIEEPAHDAAYEAYKTGLAALQANVDKYLNEKYSALVPPLRSPKQIAECILAAGLSRVDYDAFFFNQGPAPYVVGRWKAYLQNAGNVHENIFSAWRAYLAIPAAEFAAKSPGVTEGLRKENVHPLVLAEFLANPPKSLPDAANQYGKLLAANDQAEAFADPDRESLRQVLRGEGAPPNIPKSEIENLFKRDSKSPLTALRKKLIAYEAASAAAPPKPMMLRDSENIQGQRVFVRGNPGSPGDEVKPHFLTCVAGANPKPFTHGSGRLELAEAIASKDNPLTARVMVNRVWLHHFGFGIVRTPSDFGTRSDPPTHPQLLDYLAARFVEDHWSIKQLHRRIMLSATYQMASDISPEAAQRDAQNLLLSHFNRQRLDFEAMRDALLWAGGKMNGAIFGKSVDISEQPLSNRRSIYSFIDRQNLPGIFRNFDFASPDSTCPRRFNTTVPQQALFMMNSPMVIEQSRNLLARSEIAAEGDAGQRITHVYRLLFNRAPTSDEAALGKTFLAGEEQQKRDAIVWQYGYGQYDESAHRLADFVAFTHFSQGSWHPGQKVPDAKFAYVSLHATGGHPGQGPRHAVVRRWTSPIDGSIKITGSVAHPETHGDGVRARIVSSRAGELATWNVFHGEAETALDHVEVKRGDTIDFIVDCRGDDSFDSFTWTPVLRTAEVPATAGSDGPQEWNAASSFGGPEKAASSLSPWEKYVQVLLESNEFVFVD